MHRPASVVDLSNRCPYRLIEAAYLRAPRQADESSHHFICDPRQVKTAKALLRRQHARRAFNS